MKRFLTSLFANSAKPRAVRPPLTRRHRANLQLECLEERQLLSGATFVKTDTTTQGNWIGVYGHDGYNVIEAANATEALAAIDTFGPTIDLLITDIVMPGMHGDELARIVSQRFSHIAVLLISAYGDAQELTSRLQKPGCRFLAKPFSLQSFLETVAGLVPSELDQ